MSFVSFSTPRRRLLRTALAAGAGVGLGWAAATAGSPAGAGRLGAEEPAGPASPVADAKSLPDLPVVLHTDRGDVEVTLFPSKAPVTVASFVNLAKHGFYNGLTFHRVIPRFMAQGGDPTGTGSGGPGYKFEDEFDPSLRFDQPGMLAMANAGPGTNGSQFFITTVPTTWLNNHHTIFGQVTKGQEIVTALQMGDHIKGIDVVGSPAPLFAAEKARLDQWNKSLDAAGSRR